MRSVAGGVVAVVLLAVAVPAAAAKVIPPAPVADRVARSDAVVVGKVTSIDNKTVRVNETEYAVAVVQVEDAVLGAGKLTHVRVAFLPGENRRFPWLSLKIGQEACFFLRQVPKETFFATTYYFDVVPKDQANFKADLETAKKCARILQDADSSLKAGDVETRALAAAMLLTRYNTPTPSGKKEPVEAAQSKLILLALADADWRAEDFRAPVRPALLFNQLPDKEKFGWKQPADVNGFTAAAKAWLRDNAEKYRVQRYTN
jgi:hypothetical protein